MLQVPIRGPQGASLCWELQQRGGGGVQKIRDLSVGEAELLLPAPSFCFWFPAGNRLCRSDLQQSGREGRDLARGGRIRYGSPS